MHLAVGQEHSWMSSYANPILRPSSWAIITENPSNVIVPGYWNKESWREILYILSVALYYPKTYPTPSPDPGKQ